MTKLKKQARYIPNAVNNWSPTDSHSFDGDFPGSMKMTFENEFMVIKIKTTSGHGGSPIIQLKADFYRDQPICQIN